jgi:peptidyl-prolyl cis-trans isomerase D
MITFMRRLASTWVAKALFILLVLSFAVWGIEDVVRNFGRAAGNVANRAPDGQSV